MNKLKEGYLVKEGGSVKTWKKRWFILTSNELLYTRAQDDFEVLKRIPLMEVKKVEAVDNSVKGKPNTFQVVTSETIGRDFFMVAETPTEMEEWVYAIQSACGLSTAPKPIPQKSAANYANPYSNSPTNTSNNNGYGNYNASPVSNSPPPPPSKLSKPSLQTSALPPLNPKPVKPSVNTNVNTSNSSMNSPKSSPMKKPSSPLNLTSNNNNGKNYSDYDDDDDASSPTFAPNNSKDIVYVALYPYTAQRDDELTFEEGDEIVEIRKDGEWIEGSIGNKKGWLPATYVEKKIAATKPIRAGPADEYKLRTNNQFNSNPNPNSNSSPSNSIAQVVRYEKRKDTVTKEPFYLFVIQTEMPQKSTIYRRMTEFRAYYLKLAERFPDRIPELPVMKETVLTIYFNVLRQLSDFLNKTLAAGSDIVNSDITQEFLKENPYDKGYQSTEIQISSYENINSDSNWQPNMSHLQNVTISKIPQNQKDQKPSAPRSAPKFSGPPQSLTAQIIGLIKVGEGFNRHYEYQIEVIRDGERYEILRRYSEFYKLQVSLINKFPIEGGQGEISQRIIPYIPGKVYLGRSQTLEVAEIRLPELNLYIKELLALESRISLCKEVVDFFAFTEKDAKF